MTIIGENLTGNITSLPSYEKYFQEGETGELRLYLSSPISQFDIERLEQDILNQGVVLTAPITQDANILSIKFQKAIAPLVIIAIAAGAVGLVASGLVGWQIFKTTQAGVPLWVWGIGGVALLYLLLRSEPAKQAGGLAIRAGKLYIDKKMVVGNPKKKRYSK